MHIEEKYKTEINYIASIYKNNNYKKALLESNLLILKFKELENSNFFNNLLGLINLALKDWDQSILYFNRAISLNKNILDPYFNLGIAYYDIGNLEKSLEYFLKVYTSAKNHNKSKYAIIKILSFINPINNFNNNLISLNNELNQVDINFDLKRKIDDHQIKKLLENFKKISKNKIDNFEYNEDQVYRRNEIELNCERHKKIFNIFGTIPEFCFGCIKIVINLENPIDLIKLVIFFDRFNEIKSFDRKCLIEKNKNKYRGYLYFSDVSTANKISNLIIDKIEIIIGKKVNYEIKRGCSEYAEKFPEFKKVNEMMKFPDLWKENELKFDEINFKNGVPIKRNKQKSLNGMTLSDFLIFYNWVN